MGVYEYWCEKCEKVYKMWKHIKPDPTPGCPHCGKVGKQNLGMVLRFEGNQDHWQTRRAATEATVKDLVSED